MVTLTKQEQQQCPGGTGIFQELSKNFSRIFSRISRSQDLKLGECYRMKGRGGLDWNMVTLTKQEQQQYLDSTRIFQELFQEFSRFQDLKRI